MSYRFTSSDATVVMETVAGVLWKYKHRNDQHCLTIRFLNDELSKMIQSNESTCNQHGPFFILSHVSTNTKYIKLSDLVYTTRISIVILYKNSCSQQQHLWAISQSLCDTSVIKIPASYDMLDEI